MRQVQEGRILQGAQEAIAYTLTTTPWGSAPSNITAKAYDVTSGKKEDVSEQVLFNSPSASGDIITLPILRELKIGHLYRLEVAFKCSGNTFQAYVEVQAEA